MRARLEDAIELRAVLERAGGTRSTPLRRAPGCAAAQAGRGDAPGEPRQGPGGLRRRRLSAARGHPCLPRATRSSPRSTTIWARAQALHESASLWDQALVAKEIGLHEALVDAIAKALWRARIRGDFDRRFSAGSAAAGGAQGKGKPGGEGYDRDTAVSDVR